MVADQDRILSVDVLHTLPGAYDQEVQMELNHGIQLVNELSVYGSTPTLSSSHGRSLFVIIDTTPSDQLPSIIGSIPFALPQVANRYISS